MHYPDRLVRFEAAFALASGQPNQNFAGHELVAPLLAEAVAQTGSGNVLIIAPSQGDVTKLAEALLSNTAPRASHWSAGPGQLRRAALGGCDCDE